MNLKADIERFLDNSGWPQRGRQRRLARETGVPQPVISRLMTGKRQRVRSDTLAKLEPFIGRGGGEDADNPPEAA